MNQENTILTGKVYVAGSRGYSNYEIAVQNGFEGTEEEWLQSMFDYAATETANAVIEKVNDGSFGIEFRNIYDPLNETLVLELGVINDEEVNNG